MNRYLFFSFLMLALFPPAGICMIILYLYNDAKKEIFNVKEKNAYDMTTLESAR